MSGRRLRVNDGSSSDSSTDLPQSAADGSRIQRIMQRDLHMRQSWGRFNITRIGVYPSLIFADSFHRILQMSTWQLLVICLSTYTLTWLAFAGWWLSVADPCSISLDSYRQALYLSIETMMTIGFGVDDPFFNNCWEALPLLYIQSFVGLLLDIAIVGVLFQRFSRAYKRAATIIFSDFLLLRERREKCQVAFRIVEMQRHPLLQVTLQAYCILHRVDLINGPTVNEADEEADEIEEVVVHAMRLQQLDTNNNVLLCGLPMTVTHTIDRNSPLAPCNRYRFEGREPDPTVSEVEAHLASLPYVEIIITLSGVEEVTGASVEGRQSYTIEEIKSGHEFARCVQLDEHGKHCIDFELFNDTFELKKARSALTV